MRTAQGPGGLITNTDFGQSGNVVDADPRIISNLIVDQTSNNPAAVAVAGSAGADNVWDTPDDELNDGVSIIGRKVGVDQTPFTADDIVDFSFSNTAPDAGLSAPFNLWFVFFGQFFGQFFDHGLDLVEKGGSGTVFIPLQPDDPLIAGADGAFGTLDDLPASLRFMVLTRATNQPGPDGILGTADDVHEHVNQTSPFVDQNQTYTSDPSHQVFLRAYELNTERPAQPKRPHVLSSRLQHAVAQAPSRAPFAASHAAGHGAVGGAPRHPSAAVAVHGGAVVNVVISVVAILRERDASESADQRANPIASCAPSGKTTPAASEQRRGRVTARRAESERQRSAFRGGT